MNRNILMICLLISMIWSAQHHLSAQSYEPNWESINSRPVPDWFVDAKFGIFIHWGVYSVPSYRPVSERMYETYAEWYQARVMNPGDPGYRFHVDNYGADFEYREFAPMFKAELFDPQSWAKLFKRAGAQYVVLTSKHHDGFCLWPASSPFSKNWNSMDVGPERDLLGDLTKAVRDEGMRMGLYYSLMEWESTSRNHEWSGGFGDHYISEEMVEKYGIPDEVYIDQHMLPHLKELVTNYQPAVIFSDGEWDRPDSFWKSAEFLAWLYNNAPNKNVVVVNDRWGNDTRGKHGGYYTSEYSSDLHEMSAAHPWEESRGMGESYGYNRAENIDHYRSSEELIYELIKIVSHGGNLLLNVGPTADGRIPVIQQQRLVDIGKWLDTNGEAIYGSRAWEISENESNGHKTFFTTKGNDLYVISIGLPAQDIIIPGLTLKSIPETTLLGCTDCKLKTSLLDGILTINNPSLLKAQSELQYAWVFKITGVLND
jgi:alpha-L-fucosidase